MLDEPAKKEIAMQIVGTNEYSDPDWRQQYHEIADIEDGRGYTAGIVGFCSGTGDMLDLVSHYTSTTPGNVLAQYIEALDAVNGTESHDGLDPTFVPDWKTAATDLAFQDAQDHERDETYFNPAVAQGKSDGIGTLGQFIYYDALVMHGPGEQHDAFGGMRLAAMENAPTPAQGGDEGSLSRRFLDVRREVMLDEPDHEHNIDRIDTEQLVWLEEGNLNLDTPLLWRVNNGDFSIS